MYTSLCHLLQEHELNHALVLDMLLFYGMGCPVLLIEICLVAPGFEAQLVPKAPGILNDIILYELYVLVLCILVVYYLIIRSD